METRGHYLLIGAFTLAIAAAGLMFAFWIGKFQFDRQFVYYDIVFPEAVTGLTEGSGVRYLGVPVGEVYRISLDRRNYGQVRVTIRVQEDRLAGGLTIYDITQANLELLSITGGVFIQLTNPPLPEGAPPPQELPRIYVFDQDGTRPEIRYLVSTIQALLSDVPGLIQEGTELLRNLQGLTSKENQAHVTDILMQVRILTTALARQSGEIEDIVKNVGQITDNVAEASVVLPGMLDKVDGFIDRDLPVIAEGLSGAAVSFQDLAGNANRLLEDNEEAINAFLQQGLGQVALLMQDARRAMVRLERLLARFEANPSEFLFGGSPPREVRPER